MDNKIYTSRDVADILGISIQRVLALAKSRDVGTYLNPRMMVFSEADIEALRVRRTGRPPLVSTSSITDILVQLEHDGKIDDVSEARVVVRPRAGDEVVCKIRNQDDRILYIVKDAG